MITRKTNGFTLIEIMVALAIGALLLSGIVQVFISLKNTDRIALSLSRVQETGRIALDMLGYDIRMAGYKGCSDPVVADDMEIIALNPPTNNFIGSSLIGYDVTANGWAGATTLTDIDNGGVANAILNSDVLSSMHLSAASTNVTSHNLGTTTITFTGSNVLGFAAGSIASISDCGSTSLFRISAFSSDSGTGINTMRHQASENTTMSKTYTPANSEMKSLVSNAYFVGDTGRTNQRGDAINALFVRDIYGNVEEIVEGVDNMQILYGHEFITGNKRYLSASSTALDMTKVTSVQLYLLIASNDPILEVDDSESYRLGDVTIGPQSSGAAIKYANDRRLRKVFNMAINLRNRRVAL